MTNHQGSPVLWLAVLLALTACRPPAAPDPAKILGPGPGTLLRDLQLAARYRKPERLTQLLTPRCKEGCPGFAPRPMKLGGGYLGARWVSLQHPRRDLPMSLRHLLLTHRSIQQFELLPLRMRVLPGSVRVRASLLLRGRNRAGLLRVDRGVVDLTLARRQGVWGVDHLELVRLHSLWRQQPGYQQQSPLALPGDGPAKQQLTIPGSTAPAPLVVMQAAGPQQGYQLVFAHRRQVLALDPDSRETRKLFELPVGGSIRVLVPGDIDGDGRTDLFVGSYGGHSGIWLNRDTGYVSFKGLQLPTDSRVTAALLADLNGDQRLDLYVARHGPAGGQRAAQGQPNLLMINSGAAFHGLPRAAGRGWTVGVCGGDLDDDGDVDLLVVNELGRGRLWLNPGNARFFDATRASGLELPGAATSCAVGDADGDGRLDLLVGGRGAREGFLVGRPGAGVPGSWLPDRGRQRQIRAMMNGATLWLNHGLKGTGAASAGPRRALPPRFSRVDLPVQRWTAGAAMLDHDLDGRLDLLLLRRGPSRELRRRWWWQALGPILAGKKPTQPLWGRQRPGRAWLLLNPGRGAWLDASRVAGLPDHTATLAALPEPGNLGRVSLISRNLGAQPAARLWWHGGGEQTRGHAVLLKLEPRSFNRQCLGCRVLLDAEGRRQLREVGLASGMPGPPGLVHLGVGQAMRAERVQVRWPDGSWGRFDDLPVDRLVRLRQGRNPQWRDPGDPDEAATSATTPRIRPASQPRAEPSPLLAPLKLTVSRAGKVQPLSALAGARATLLLLFSTGPRDRTRCARLHRLTRRQRGVRMVAVRLRASTKTTGACGGPLWQATPNTRTLLQGQRALLPLLLLVDAKGKLHHLASDPRPVLVEAQLLQLLQE